MASYLRPRRGKKATATTNNIVLKRGEVFFEVPDTGVGTGMGKIKMGDGTTAYGSLPYFNEAIDPSTITGIQNSITQLNNDIVQVKSDLTISKIVGNDNVSLAQNVSAPFATFNVSKNGIGKANFHIMLTSSGNSLTLAVKVNGVTILAFAHGGGNVQVIAGVDYTMDSMFEVKSGDVVTFEVSSSATNTITARCFAITNLKSYL
jgi:hypothetical protein